MKDRLSEGLPDPRLGTRSSLSSPVVIYFKFNCICCTCDTTSGDVVVVVVVNNSE